MICGWIFTRYASELTLPKSTFHVHNVPSLKELTDFQQLPENPLDMLARLFWVGVSLLESDFEHEFVMAVNLIEEVRSHTVEHLFISSNVKFYIWICFIWICLRVANIGCLSVGFRSKISLLQTSHFSNGTALNPGERTFSLRVISQSTFYSCEADWI